MRRENSSNILDFLSADALAAKREDLADYIRWIREGIALNGVRRLAPYEQIFTEQWELLLTLKPDWDTQRRPATQRQHFHADRRPGRKNDRDAGLQRLQV